MNEVAVIGLGAMGSALARTLLRSGHRLTVWNRTKGKASSLVVDGAVLAPDTPSAVAASQVVIVCVDNYEVTRAILGTEGTAAGLSGKNLVQLSTGSPQEARDLDAWARDRGIKYLDGAILAFPDQIGTPDATILVSGDASAFSSCEPLLTALAPNLSFLGGNVGAASALDCAVLSFFVGALVGALHGARICEVEGLPVDEFGSLLADIAPIVGGDVKHLGESIHAGNYENPQALLKTWEAAVQRIGQQAQDTRINSEFPTFVLKLLQKGVSAGYEMEGVSSLIKVLRATA